MALFLALIVPSNKSTFAKRIAEFLGIGNS